MPELKVIPRSASQEIAEHWLQSLREQGYRSTAARRAVAHVLARSESALRPQEIHAKARQIHPRIGLVTVYRSLEAMEALGLIQSIHLPDGSHGYLAEFSGHQHLLACLDCGKVLFFEGDDMSELVQALEQQSGYQIEAHSLFFEGHCEDCRAE